MQSPQKKRTIRAVNKRVSGGKEGTRWQAARLQPIVKKRGTKKHLKPKRKK